MPKRDTKPSIPTITIDDYEIVDIDTLQPHPENPRRGNVDLIAESIREHGQYRPICVQRSTRYVIAGNHTYRAAVASGMTEIAVTWQDVTDAEARRIMLVDNRTTDAGTYDSGQLLILLDATRNDYGDLLGTGYDDAARDLLAAVAAGPVDTFDPNDEWTGMPEFQQPDLNSAFRTTIHFATEQDADAFFRTIERPRARVMWWPEHDGHKAQNIEQFYVHGD